jgi:spore coat polysaccharide biosynthesis protein SpsF
MIDLVTIIQARMGSSRLPGKVLMPLINECSSLECMINRVLQSKYISRDNLIIATSELPQDEKINKECFKLGIKCFRGSENNVLKRFYEATKMVSGNTEYIIRLTADCPLHDPNVIDAFLDYFFINKVDYMSNTAIRSFPKGLDIEIMTKKSLEIAYQNARLDSEKEHVTPYIRNNPDQFKIGNFTNDIDWSHHRWTLDYEDDYKMMCAVYKELYPESPNFKMMDVVNLLEERPDIYEITAHLPRD